MRVRIKRIDKDLPLPTYQTAGAVAFDLYARERVEIAAGSVARIPTNVVVKVPKGFMLLLKDRSSMAIKKGLISVGGVVDQDYCGDTDEILFQVYNFTSDVAIVERGERIGQAVFVKIEKGEWKEVETMDASPRGGFGTTGS